MKLTELARKTPEALDPSWQLWVDLVELAVAESQQPVWSGVAHIPDHRAPEAPLLHGATLHLPARAREFASRLADHLGIGARESVDPLELIRVGVERDRSDLDFAASTLIVSTETVALLGQLSALPVLLNVARSLSPEESCSWQRGYCPVCGAWPSMVEMRGIQRERRLRCGCCGSDWLLPVLRCAFCDETDHRKLGSLLNEAGDQHIRVETCATCRGYLKSLTTLGRLPFTTLAVKDLSTIAFDLAAHDRGFSRPARPGWQVHVEIVQ